MTDDSTDRLYGEYRATLSPEGLAIFDGGDKVFAAPVYTGSRYLGGSSFRIEKGDRRVTFRVQGVGCPGKLAENAVGFLSGRLKKLDAGKYDNPAWLLAFAPISLPVGVILFGLVGGVICGIASAISAAIARKRGLGIGAKLALILGAHITALAISFAVVLFVLVPYLQKLEKQQVEAENAQRRQIAKEENERLEAARKARIERMKNRP